MAVANRQQRRQQKPDALDLYYSQKQQKAKVINMVQEDIQKIETVIDKKRDRLIKNMEKRYEHE